MNNRELNKIRAPTVLQARERDRLDAEIARLEGELEERGPWWYPGRLGLVDSALAPIVARLGVTEHYRGIGMPDQCVRLSDWWIQIEEQPSFVDTLETPDSHSGCWPTFLIEVYARYARA